MKRLALAAALTLAALPALAIGPKTPMGGPKNVAILLFPGVQIIDYTGNPYTVAMLVETLHIQKNLIFLRYDPDSPVDVVVNLGDDWAGQIPP